MVGLCHHCHMNNHLWMIVVAVTVLVIIFSPNISLNSYVVVSLRVWWQPWCFCTHCELNREQIYYYWCPNMQFRQGIPSSF